MPGPALLPQVVSQMGVKSKGRARAPTTDKCMDLILFLDLFHFNYVRVSAGVCGINALQLELQMFASCPVWVLGTEFQSSGRLVHTFKH